MNTYNVVQPFSALTSTFDCKEASRYYVTGIHLEAEILITYDGKCNIANDDMIMYGVPVKAIRKINNASAPKVS
jgi:glycerol-3-phosphate dehydrogenase